ncbi:TIGR00282 family metallophosphoesterase [Mycoplasmopsis lipofaciens]|uniref:TIGR00282 family metallophosphoesterase n=1 Tax=Mycoplasmopsis lipofaciens TaxID=114884 RepID=UPI0004857188|nr:TIGR00282 family metallophosphoesterase [Mycoplasmopsis lipofaciens]
MEKNKKLNILFIGDVFGEPGIKIIRKWIPKLKKEYFIDVVIAQSENVSGRKGLTENDYKIMKKAGVDLFTLGNHVWAKPEIFKIINNGDLIRPANISESYPGLGSLIYRVNSNITLRVTSLMGITFNKLSSPWSQEYANNFFDVIDNIIKYEEKTDFHFIDFHGETTSEKYVMGLYLDGRVDGFCGTHTHVQTNDGHVLPNGTCYITDVGSCGPYNSAIGANFEEVYRKMRYGDFSKFQVSGNKPQFNAVVLKLNSLDKELNEIITINIVPEVKWKN